MGTRRVGGALSRPATESTREGVDPRGSSASNAHDGGDGARRGTGSEGAASAQRRDAAVGTRARACTCARGGVPSRVVSEDISKLCWASDGKELCVPLVLLRKCWWRAYRWVGRMRMSAWHESQCLAWRLGPGRWGGDRGVRAGCACGLRATHTNHVHEHDGRRRGATQPATSGRVAHIKTQSRMAGPGVRFWRVCNKYVPSASLVTTALTALRRVLRMVLRVNQSAIVAVAHA